MVWQVLASAARTAAPAVARGASRRFGARGPRRGTPVPGRGHGHGGAHNSSPMRPGGRPTKAHKEVEPRDTYQKLWSIESAQNILSRLYENANKSLPFFGHSITVTVRGGPEADLRRIWYLCAAAAFGRYRNRAPSVQNHTLEANWDITGKACSMTVGYVAQGLWDQGARSNFQFADFPTLTTGLGLIQRGPDQITIGANWPAFTWTGAQAGLVNVLPTMIGGLFTVTGLVDGILAVRELLDLQGGNSLINTEAGFTDWNVVQPPCPSNAPYTPQIFGASGTLAPNILGELPFFRSYKTVLPWRRVQPGGQNSVISFASVQSPLGDLPLLPDDGRVITTGEKKDPRVQSPRPALDGISRSCPIALVTQSLQSPCYIVTPPPCPQAPLGSPGARAYPAGTGNDRLQLNNKQITQAVVREGQTFFGSIAQLFGRILSRDGYAPLPREILNVRQ